jgi:hypothetical protein
MKHEPRASAQEVERRRQLPSGSAEGFSGYGVMSMPFASGHVLALRRFPASAVGPAFTSVWHRSPAGRWTFYTDVSPLQSCPRYFSNDLAQMVVAPIELAWHSACDLSVAIRGDIDLDWRLRFAPTPATRALNAMGAAMPEPLWRSRWVLAIMGRMAGRVLGAGRIRLQGLTPNHQWFLVNPRLIWHVVDSQARLHGEDFGLPAPLAEQAHLADFWLPQVGLFAVGQTMLEPLDPSRHAMPAIPISG